MTILHHHPGRAHSVALAILLLLLAASGGGLGCGQVPRAPDLPPAEALRLQFPAQASAVLAPAAAFMATERGFTLSALTTAGAERALQMTLPRDGRQALTLRDRGGFEVRVRELGLDGEGSRAENVIAYRRAGGASFWSAAPRGVEEWLHLEAGAVRAGEPAAVWEIEGATVRTRGEGVEIVDAAGVARLSVTAPRAYAEGGRVIHAWMAGGGGRLELWVAPEERPVLVDPLWTLTGSLITGRAYHTATLLQGGQVLVMGGQAANSAYLRNTELYDPVRPDMWTAGESLAVDREVHTATLLTDGRVLVVGGFGSGGKLDSAEIYNPATGAFTSAGPLNFARVYHTATRLADGRVLVTGGNGASDTLDSAEIYDPMNDAFTLVNGLMKFSRYAHTATLLTNGQVLIVGGGPAGAGYLDSAEIYDPKNQSFTLVDHLATARGYHTATLLPSGKVLVVGGEDEAMSKASAEIYDPTASAPAWSSAGMLSQGRSKHTATLLPSGQVLVVGGEGTKAGGSSAEIYDPTTISWKGAGVLSKNRNAHSATLLPSGQVLVAGGEGYDGTLASVELYAPPCTAAVDCQYAASGECEVGRCDLVTKTCVGGQKLDGAPCSKGICIAGGCFAEGASSVVSSSAVTSGGASSGGGAVGNVSSGGATSMGVGSSGAGGGGGAGEFGGGGEGGEIRLHGGACGLARGGGAEGAPWLLLALGVVRRRWPRGRGERASRGAERARFGFGGPPPAA